MKKITLWLLALFGCCQMNAQLWTITECLTVDLTTYGPMNSTATANATNRMAVVYPASQLTGVAGQNLNAMYFRRAGTTAMLGTPSFKIYLKEVTATDWGTGALDWATAVTGAVLVYDSNPIASVGSSAGWKSFPFSTNFVYSGTQNLAVFYEYTNPVASNTVNWSYEFQGPCVSAANVNTSKYTNNTTGTLPTSLTSSNERRPLIGFDYVISCPKPTGLLLSDITTNSADLTWTPGGTETQWQYAVVPAGSGIPATSTLIGSNTLTDIPLSPGTNYEVYVRAYCGSDDVSLWVSTGSFSTLCTEVVLFSENFDSYPATATSMPNCWSKKGNGTTNISTGGAAPGTPPNRLYMTATGSGTTPTIAYALMPTVSNLQANTHRLKFRAFSSTAANRPLDVGYFTDPDDTNSFVLIQTVNLPGTAATTAAVFTIAPTGIPAGVNRLVFKNSGITTGATVVYIDDVAWETLPLCGDMTGLNASDITSNSALIYWEPGDSVTAWQYVYGPATTTDPSTLTPVDVTSNPYDTLNALQAATVYKYWVRSNCNGVFGAWSDPFTFTTLCGVVIPEYVQNFATFPPLCWTRAGAGTVATGPTGTAAGIWVADGFLNSGTTGAVKVNLYDLNRIGWLISPTMDLSGDDYMVSFNYGVTTFAGTAQSPMGADDTVKLLISEDDGSTWAEMISFGPGSNVLNTNQSVTLQITSESTTAKFAFFATDGTVDNPADYDFFIDNFKIELIPDCAAPLDVVAGAPLSDTTATVSWSASFTPPANGYEFYANTANVTPAADITVNGSVGAGLTTGTVTQLSANTTYYVWVRSVCGPTSRSVWSTTPGSFKTDCQAVTTFSENFDSYTSTGSGTPMPNCWKRAGNALTYIATGGAVPGTPPNRLYMTGNASAATPTESFAIMPPVSNLQAGTHRLKFSAYATTTGKFVELGYFGDASDVTTFTLLETFDLPGITAATAENFSIIPQAVPAGITTLAFRNPGTATAATVLYIDNVVWEAAPTCPDVNGLTFDGATATTADISWNPGGSETAWEYAYGATTVTDPNTLTAYEVSNNPSTTITPLTASTTYKVWVRAKCGAQSGIWSLPITFTTPCLPITVLPWNEGFEGITTVSTTAFPDCWFEQNGDWSSALASTYNTPKSGTKYIRNYYIANNEFMWTPGFELTAGVSYDFSFFAQGDGHTGWVVDLFYNNIQNSAGATQFGDSYTPPGNGITAIQPYYELKNSFMVPTTGVYYFAIRVNDPPTSNAWYIAFDDFKLELTPSCASPSAVSVDDITANTATVNWNPSVTVPTNGYQYFRDTSSTPPTAATIPTGSVGAGITEAPLTDLAPSTTYYVWVRSFCGTDEYSGWTNTISFSTTCATLTIPTAVQNFDGTTGSALPNCWSNQLVSGSNNWVTYTPLVTDIDITTTVSGSRVAFKDYNTSEALLYSPPINYSAVTVATQVNLYLHRHASAPAGDKYTIYVNTAPTITGAQMILEIFSRTTIAPTVTATGFYNYTADIPASFHGQPQVYVILKGYTGNGFSSYALGMEDFKVEFDPDLSNPIFDTAAFKAYPNPVKDILNLSYTENISSIAVFNLLGQQVVVKSLDAKQAQIDMSHLASGTYLVKVIAECQVKTFKIIKE